MFSTITHTKCGPCNLDGNSRWTFMDDTFWTWRWSWILCRMLCLAWIVNNSAYVSIINGSFAQLKILLWQSYLVSFGVIQTSSAETHVAENYLLALCESDRKEQILQLFDIVDITKLSPPDSVANIFRSLGRLLLESSAEKYLMAFKNCGMFINIIISFMGTDISFFIQGFWMGLQVEADIILGNKQSYLCILFMQMFVISKLYFSQYFFWFTN